MTAFVFANYVDTTLAAAASSTATSLSLSSSANLPVLGPGEIMPLTLNDAATGLVYEIVYVTAISGTTLTVLRGQEGTAAQNWSSGDYAFVSPTADTVAPVAGTHSPVASETLPVVNELITTPGTLTADIDLTLNDVAPAGSGGIVFGSESAFSVTVQSPVTTGSPYIELPDGSQVYSWTIPASEPGQGIRYKWDGVNWRARTFGQEVVAPATQNNAAVNLGQLTNGSFTPRFSQIARQSSQNNQNWLPNSSFLYGFAGWTVPSGSSIGQVNAFTYSNYNGTNTSVSEFVSVSTGARTSLIYSGQSATLSAWVFNGTAGAPATLQLNCYNSSGSLISSICQSSLAAGNNWTFLTASGTTPSGLAYVQVVFSFTGVSTGSSISISQIKLEIGSVATPWSDESSAGLFTGAVPFNPTFDGVTNSGNETIAGTLAVTGAVTIPAATASNQAVNLGQLFIGNRKAVFTANGTYTVPAGVTTLWVSGCAGGGGGSGGGASNSATGGAGSGAGGGAGEPILRQEYSVAPGDSISITIGAGGAGGAGGAADGGSGAAGAGGGNTVVTNSTTATTLVTLTGGGGGKGGSGGGSGGGLGGAGYPQGSDGTDGAVIAGVGGPGGSGPFGGGGGAARGANGTVNDGHNAYGYGSGGGGGGCCYDSTTVAAGAGGNGTPGIIIVEW